MKIDSVDGAGMDMRYGTWNVRGLCRADSLMTVPK
jgi:hypothetical protein